jgi:hypothetical protein
MSWIKIILINFKDFEFHFKRKGSHGSEILLKVALNTTTLITTLRDYYHICMYIMGYECKKDNFD